MTIQEAIEARHSVRAYKSQPLTDKVVKVLNDKIAEINKEGSLHVVGLQDVQHLRCDIGVGAIVKGKIDPIIRVGFVGVNLDGTLHLCTVAAAIADGIGQSICTDRRSIHAAADFDSRGQVAIHIVTGAVAGILEAAAHGNID